VWTLSWVVCALKELGWDVWPKDELNDRGSITGLLWKPNVHYRVYNSPPLVPVLSQNNPVHNLSLYFSKVHSNIILQSTPPQYAFMAWCSVKAQGPLYLYL
jgi:hypothetical protein